ncbi:MAG: peroxiredoxin-like family protein [Planctomycetota bacterium]
MQAMNLVGAVGLAGVVFTLASCGQSSSESASTSTESETATESTGESTGASTDITSNTEVTNPNATEEADAKLQGLADSLKQQGNDMAQDATSGGSLTKALDEAREASTTRLSPDIKELFAEGIADVENSGILASAKNVGDDAPEFVLPDAVGRSVSLAELLGEGPVVLVWYRGGWCPYCNITLRAYQERLDDIKAAGATLVAISPEVPDKSLDTRQKNELDFAVLSDVRNVVAKQYGVVFELMPAVADKYRELGLNLLEYNGNESNELPLSATYVIGQDGKITYSFLDADYTKRADPDEVMAALQGSQG